MPDNIKNSDIKIMIVEDETIIAKDIENILINYGFDVIGPFSKAEDAINKVTELKPDLILMDIVLKGNIDGIEAATKINAKYQVPIIYLTAYADENTLSRIIKTAPYGYFLKPFEEKELYTWIHTTLYKFKKDREIENKLQNAERDLRQIEYLASHDMQEPLRMVASYVRLLQKKYQNKIDGDADEFINFTLDGVRHLKEILNNIYDFIKLDQNDFKPEKIDLNNIIKEINNSLKVVFESSLFDIKYNSLPTIIVDKQHIKTLLFNLLSNVIKTSNSDPCIIQISWMNEKNKYYFSISNNGVTNNYKLENEVLNLTQNTEKNKYTGNDFLLAMCQKIIEIYNGELWVPIHTGEVTIYNFTFNTNGRYTPN